MRSGTREEPLPRYYPSGLRAGDDMPACRHAVWRSHSSRQREAGKAQPTVPSMTIHAFACRLSSLPSLNALLLFSPRTLSRTFASDTHQRVFDDVWPPVRG